MKMNLSQILALSDTTKPIYDSRRRHADALLSWMDDFETYFGDNEAVHEYEAKRNRYRIEHALALAAFNAFTRIGVSPAVADYVVGNRFNEIIEAVADASIDPENDIGRHGELETFHLALILFGDVGRQMHVSGRLTDCQAEYRKFQLEANQLRAERGGQLADGDSPVALVTVDMTAIYRRLKAKLLSGLSI